jgi:hypothetical protein
MTIVYKHIRLDTNEVFYIGIGKRKDRPYSSKNRNKHWHRIVDKHGYRVEIIRECDSWEEACYYEKKLISEYGRRDINTGILVNMTDGGEGKLNFLLSEETKRKISNSLIGNSCRIGKKHTDETKKKISQISKINFTGSGNPHFGKKHSKESIEKMRIAKLGKYEGVNNPNFGRKLSDESKKRIGDSKRGKKLTPEQLKNRVNKKWINDGMTQKFVSKDEISNYLSNGWKTGRLRKSNDKL